MVKSHKVHKLSGITAGVLLLLLSISGFFLDHKTWNFLYTTTFKQVPSHTLQAEKRLLTSYYRDKSHPNHIITGGYRGLFESFDGGRNFSTVTTLQVLSIVPWQNRLYLATSDGLYSYSNRQLYQLALSGEYLTALSVSNDTIVAVIEKHTLVVLERKDLKVLKRTRVKIPKTLLQEDISLSRFVRDLHYGRGLFDGDISLFINDYGALLLIYLGLSGYLIWFLIRQKRYPKFVRKLIKTHANAFAVAAVVPLFILAVTGLFLDHASALSRFMKSVSISHTLLPPVYSTLQNDIWSVDYDGKVYRIGNRYGVYKSDDLKKWSLESRGFAYKMMRRDGILYVSGMGSANRVFREKNFTVLPKTPHMFRDVVWQDGNVRYFSSAGHDLPIPRFDTITLYTLLLSIHDGSFFAPWWVWINDFGALLLLLLMVTGIIRWRKRSASIKGI